MTLSEVLNSPAWEFSQTWVERRIAVIGEEKGTADPEVLRRAARILLISRIGLILLIAVIFDMVVKPSLSRKMAPGTLVACR